MIFRVLLSCFLCFSIQVNAQLIKVPGTSIFMDPPAGFGLSQNFSGFEDAKTKSSIMIVEFPKASYDELAELFLDLDIAKKHLSAQGVSINHREEVTVGEDKAPILLLSGVQTFEEKEIMKHIALIEGEATILISYNIFDKSVYSKDVIIDTLTKITVGKEASLKEQLNHLNFTFKEKGNFKIDKVVAGSSAILVDSDSKSLGVLDARLVIESSVTKVDALDKEYAAKALLFSVPGFENADLNAIHFLEFAGMKSIRIKASTENNRIIQFTAFDSDGTYIRLIATGDIGKMNIAESAIDEVAHSVKMKGKF